MLEDRVVTDASDGAFSDLLVCRPAFFPLLSPSSSGIRSLALRLDLVMFAIFSSVSCFNLYLLFRCFGCCYLRCGDNSSRKFYAKFLRCWFLVVG